MTFLSLPYHLLTFRHSSYRTLFSYAPRRHWMVSSSSIPSNTFSSSSKQTGAMDSNLVAHLSLLSLDNSKEDAEELAATPIFTQAVHEYGSSLKTATRKPFAQYGLLAGIIENTSAAQNGPAFDPKDPRLFFNTSTPSSVFICGSQGSGKSHTLSCILENCLMQSKASVLHRPLTGIVFHYDPWVSASRGSPCEAAYLASAQKISVRVLCPPTNVKQIEVRQDERLKIKRLILLTLF